jgi:hypothetical protein
VHTAIYDDKIIRKLARKLFAISYRRFDRNNRYCLSRFSIVTKASIENEQPIERDNHYKSYWRNINNLKIKSLASLMIKQQLDRKCST